MKVKDLIEQLKKFDGELAVAAYLENDSPAGVFEIDVPHDWSRCQRQDNGAIKFIARDDPNGLKVVLLEVSEA
jgi:hypothetical protein